MKSRSWMVGVGVCLAMGMAGAAFGAEYYINDTYVPGDDVYTYATGNDGNPGTALLPKATLGNVIGTCNLQPGDVVYIDTGTYASGAVISNTVVGTAGNAIRFQGSTNVAAGGTVFSGGGNNLTVRGQHLILADIRTAGGSIGVEINNANHCEFYRVWAISNSVYAVNMSSASSSNRFQWCALMGSGAGLRTSESSVRDNYLRNSVIQVSQTAISGFPQFFSISDCTISGGLVFFGDAYIQTNVVNSMFWGMQTFSPGLATLADVMRVQPGWRGNTVADPQFVNAGALDFHLLSTTGYATNGNAAVTNVAVVHSPAIDFGARGASVGDEPDPNGGRVNIGLYGGTAEASKSRTGPWTFAMSFNDGGTLWQTGRLEWVASTNLNGADVALEYSTNQWATADLIATVPATNEFYLWEPTFSHPAVHWRVRDPGSGFASTNAKVFSIRATTNAVFSFYVNDASTNHDVYCAATGSVSNTGISSNSPMADLQALLATYDLEGGDTVYVDTGDYLLTQTVSVGLFDSGRAGAPVRLIGSSQGSTLNRGSTLNDVLDITGASHLEISDLIIIFVQRPRSPSP